MGVSLVTIRKSLHWIKSTRTEMIYLSSDLGLATDLNMRLKYGACKKSEFAISKAKPEKSRQQVLNEVGRSWSP